MAISQRAFDGFRVVLRLLPHIMSFGKKGYESELNIHQK
jgi:hypothetical protein